MKSLTISVVAFFLCCLSAQACLDADALVSEGVDRATAQALLSDMKAMKLGEFTDRFCSMDYEHRIFTTKIYGAAYSELEAADRQTLLRMAIIAQGMAAHVAYIADFGELKVVDDEWESTAILRFLQYLRTQFPATKSLLDEAYMTRMEALFQKALDHVKSREQEEDRKIDEARNKIADLENQKAHLLDAIEAMKDKRLGFRGMRQELEAQTR